MSDEEIDLSENPEATPEMFANAVVRRGLTPVSAKTAITVNVDTDVLTWLKSRGEDEETQINRALRAYMKACQTK